MAEIVEHSAGAMLEPYWDFFAHFWSHLIPSGFGVKESEPVRHGYVVENKREEWCWRDCREFRGNPLS
jgi:hypothetical protein